MTHLGYNGLCTFVLPICLFCFRCFRCFSPCWIAGLHFWRLLTLPSAVCLLPFISSNLSVRKKSLQPCLNKVKNKFFAQALQESRCVSIEATEPISQNLFLLSWCFQLTSCFLFLFWEMHLEKLLKNIVVLPNKVSFTPVTELISRHKPMNFNIANSSVIPISARECKLHLCVWLLLFISDHVQGWILKTVTLLSVPIHLSHANLEPGDEGMKQLRRDAPWSCVAFWSGQVFSHGVKETKLQGKEESVFVLVI